MQQEGYDLIIITDPEMVLDTDPLVQVPIEAIAYWLTDGRQRFPSLAELLVERRLVEAALGGNIEPWQRALALPSWVWWEPAGIDLRIYGWLPSAAEMQHIEQQRGASKAESSQLAWRMGNARGRGWAWGRWYSRYVPEGEWGAVHLSHVGGTMTHDEFASVVGSLS